MPVPSNHPGSKIRQEIDARGLTITEAARRLCVSRPTLSNLLNEKSSLSSEMAARLESVFGLQTKRLLADQTTESPVRPPAGREIATVASVPALGTIKARDIEAWVSGAILPRQLLAVFLRKLVLTTSKEVATLDFPGYDNAEQKGWDGWLETSSPTPWTPRGFSGWEFGCNENPGKKAEKDYKARTNSTDRADRAGCVFVFVTPRNWPGKAEWLKAKRAANEWKDVRALDSSDLEQWVEQSVPAQIWLTEQLGRPLNGYRSLDYCWAQWSEATCPPMPCSLFASPTPLFSKRVSSWLKSNPHKPFVITADSRDEALAFLASAFKGEAVQSEWNEKFICVDTAEALSRLCVATPGTFVLIVTKTDVERELAPFLRSFHCIVVLPRNQIGETADFELEPLRPEEFRAALKGMGYDSQQISRLARASACSPTILRRRLALSPAASAPLWSRDYTVARMVVPFVLAGVWHNSSASDREVIGLLASGKQERLEESVALLLNQEEPPIWGVSGHTGITSKLDSFFAIAKLITRADLENFFFVAELVLSESDPALDLPPEERILAGLYGKVRQHSSALRRGILDTLILLAVHGDSQLMRSTGVSVEAGIQRLVHKLLRPLKYRELVSGSYDLPSYAEAAPDVFLELIENDLQKPDPATVRILESAPTAAFSGCSRSGLLWALECLAWDPKLFPRVAYILARLCSVPIVDNWANRPDSCLQSLFRSWMPQTDADVSLRIRVLEQILDRYPDAGWKLCLSQIWCGHRVGTYNYRPRWRPNSEGAGKPVSWGEDSLFRQACFDLALSRLDPTARMLGDLLEAASSLSEEQRAALWARIFRWAKSGVPDRDKAELRECVRAACLTRRGRWSTRGLDSEKSQKAYRLLTPSDLVLKHRWLFASAWIPETVQELEEEQLDYAQRHQRISKERMRALRQIWKQDGFDGLLRLLEGSGAGDVVGCLSHDLLKSMELRVALTKNILTREGSEFDECLHGFLCACSTNTIQSLDIAVFDDLDGESRTRFLQALPFCLATWNLIHNKGEDFAQLYWGQVSPHWTKYSAHELNEVVDRLLQARRPRAAAHAARMEWERLETSRLLRLLDALVSIDCGEAQKYRLESHDISQIFEVLDQRPEVTLELKARLEITYLEALETSRHGVPNLALHIEKSPYFFVELLMLCYKRDDGGVEEQADSDSSSSGAMIAYKVLAALRRIPGCSAEGEIDSGVLGTWVRAIRSASREIGRIGVCESSLGKLLARGPKTEEEGLWPCRAVAEVLEEVGTDDICEGFVVGTLNSRGMVCRVDGGKQEHELVRRYLDYAGKASWEFPFVSRVLTQIANYYRDSARSEDEESELDRRLLAW